MALPGHLNLWNHAHSSNVKSGADLVDLDLLSGIGYWSVRHGSHNRWMLFGIWWSSKEVQTPNSVGGVGVISKLVFIQPHQISASSANSWQKRHSWSLPKVTSGLAAVALWFKVQKVVGLWWQRGSLSGEEPSRKGTQATSLLGAWIFSKPKRKEKKEKEKKVKSFGSDTNM